MDDADFPPVTPGVKVLIQLRDHDQNNIKSPVVEMVVNHPDDCYNEQTVIEYGPAPAGMHLNTICTYCIPDWAQDWYITLGDTPADLGFRS